VMPRFDFDYILDVYIGQAGPWQLRQFGLILLQVSITEVTQ
jgi:hypothetical protein